MHKEHHFSNRLSWLRAGVMGANDGIISMSGLVVGLASSSITSEAVFLGALTALIAGALSMGVGEFISVSSQADSELADIQREQQALTENPEEELQELVMAYKNKGLSTELAEKVAHELSKSNPLKAHLAEELNYDEDYKAQPWQAAFVSLVAFLIGGGIPVLVSYLSQNLLVVIYPMTILALILLGYISAKMGGVSPLKAILRIVVLGVAVLVLTQILGSLY